LKRRKHGERNKELAEELFKQGKYFDWVVTVAFYSAIHFVEDKILPCTINSVHCKSITEVRNAYNMKGRHSSREKLVASELNNVWIQYKWLDDKSRYSRYTTFKVTKTEAEKAIQFLNKIFKECYNK
jgi:HEPN domain-containing protein